MSLVTLGQSYYLQTCCDCGVGFAVPEYFDKMRRNDGKLFYCPNGHSQSYSVSTVQRLEKQLADAERSKQFERNQRFEAEAALAKAERAAHRLKKRIAAGVCPCCNRTFGDLARHMKTKHDSFALPPGETHKLLAGKVQ